MQVYVGKTGKTEYIHVGIWLPTSYYVYGIPAVTCKVVTRKDDEEGIKGPRASKRSLSHPYAYTHTHTRIHIGTIHVCSGRSAERTKKVNA